MASCYASSVSHGGAAVIVTWMVVMGCAGSDEPVRPGPAPLEAPPPAPDWPAPTEARYAGSHILIAWKGAVDAPASVTRTEAEAEALARDLVAKVTPATFAELAREHSDGPSAPRGGRLGSWLTGSMVPEFERAVASVEVGAVGPVVRTPFGWHVVMREAIAEVSVSHILVSHVDALQSTSGRTPAEARALAEQLRERVVQGEAFASVARDASEDRSSERGGSLGLITRGSMVPAFEDAAFALKPGAVSPVVETPYWLHVIERSAAQ